MIPTIKDIEFPLLKLLYSHESLSWDECTDKLAIQFNLSSDARKLMMPNGKCGTFRYRVGWAKANLKRLGLVDAKKRGVYYITHKGIIYIKDKNI
ncbi:MAG: winged helix-turn-helix domain-containing protein [Muribaculaceae bacterium]|nr:winged helix-turn-helix domain-containing protein [Muribaculaceae bacterium]